MPSASSAPRQPLVLVVDDDEGLLVLMSAALRADGFAVATEPSLRGARTWLERATPELMILDLKLRDGGGTEMVKSLRLHYPDVPFIVVTGQGDEKVAVEVMKHGALDYVMKDSGMVDLLPTVVRRALATVAQDKALASAQAEQKRLEGEIDAAGQRERHMIGADLHDGLGQQLTAIELMCASLKSEVPPDSKLATKLGEVARMLRDAIAQTRFLSRGLVPVGAEPDSLQNGLAELAARTNALGGSKCVFDCPGPVMVDDPAVAGHLYRIAQEAVNNAVKHARARTIRVALTREPDAITLEVADDGKGLGTGKNRPADGIGFGVMQHRAKLIGGDLTISSKRGEGVVIACRLPVRR